MKTSIVSNSKTDIDGMEKTKYYLKLAK